MKLKHIIILQNKIDLVTQNQAKEQQQQILKFVQGDELQPNFDIRSCCYVRFAFVRLLEFVFKRSSVHTLTCDVKSSQV